jgi:uncharacterized protein YjbI with pentapeptide repeats
MAAMSATIGFMRSLGSWLNAAIDLIRSLNSWLQARSTWELLLGLVALFVASKLTQGLSLGSWLRARALWVLGTGALLVALVGVYVLPLILVPDEGLDAEKRLKAENDFRSVLIQALGGSIVLIGTARTLHINREGQITERFTRAIDQLGQTDDDKLDVRLGGIYALERIARDSKSDRGPIIEVLTAFLREHARWKPDDQEATPNASREPELSSPVLPRLRADFQAVVTVLGRNNWAQRHRFNLSEVDLRKAHLDGAHLQRADLEGANLKGAQLIGSYLEWANLQRADLEGANLDGAHLERVDLEGANLKDAQLIGSHLEWANLQRADLEGANLKEANLWWAHLEGADLKEANLERAHLSFAQLSRTDLSCTHGLTRGQLRFANTYLSSLPYEDDGELDDGDDV